MLSAFHKHNTLIFSQYFSPSQREILGISLVILLHLLWHGSPIPWRKNIRKTFIFFSTSLILKNIYCFPSSIPSPFPDLMFSYCWTRQRRQHSWFLEGHIISHTKPAPTELLANCTKWRGQHCQENTSEWGKFLITNHRHPLNPAAVECWAELNQQHLDPQRTARKQQSRKSNLADGIRPLCPWGLPGW